MGGVLPVVSSKTLPVASDLPATSLPPRASTSKLALLASSPSAPESRLALYRTSTTAELVWEWTPPPPSVDPSAGGAKPGGKLGLGLKGKGKAAQGAGGKIDQVAWSPTGNAIAVLVSPAAASRPPIPSLALLSVQNGTPICPPIPLSTPLTTASSTSAAAYLSWQALPSTALPTDPLGSFSIALIRRLPALPKIAKETLPAAGDTATPGGPSLALGGARIGGPGGGGGAGVFGAKQAMLERERAKEAQRALSMRTAVGEGGQFPRLTSMGEAGVGAEGSDFGDDAVRAVLLLRDGGDLRVGEADTVMCVGGEDGTVQLFLGGSVHLGSVNVGGRIHAITVPESSAPNAAQAAISLAVHHSTSAAALSVSQLSIPTPSSLLVVLDLSSTLAAHFEHAFEALQGARNMWDEARRIGKGWLQRIADVSRPHGVTTSPTTQLHLLLLTGRPTRSLHDFLASKMNERVLAKWEQAMGAALERLRKVAWMSVVPALERIVVMLKEVEAWSTWLDKFASYGFSQTEIRQVSRLVAEALAATARMQRGIEEEERCFKQFGVWLHFELDKVAQQEGSEIRPLANFLPLPVSHYIRNCLPATGSQITPYLSFGLATAPLSANGDLRAAEEWLDSLASPPAPDHVNRPESSRDSDTSPKEMLKRMSEELRGQVDAGALEARHRLDHPLDLVDAASPFASSTMQQTGDALPKVQPILPAPAFAVAHAASTHDPEYEIRPPSRSTVGASGGTPAKSAPTRSIPVLLHLAVKIAAGLMDRAVRRATGDRAVLSLFEGPRPVLDLTVPTLAVRTVIERSQEREVLYEMGIAGDTAVFSSRDLGSGVSQQVVYKLATTDGVVLRPIQFAFSSPREAVFAVSRITDGAAGPPVLAVVDLHSLGWSTSPASVLGPLPFAQQYPLDEHFPPTALAFSHPSDEIPLVATLAGEGRRLEVLEIKADQADVHMQS